MIITGTVSKTKYEASGIKFLCPKESRKKKSSLNGRAIKKKNFFGTFFFQSSKISTAIKLDGGLGLNGPAIKRRTFFSAFLKKSDIQETFGKSYIFLPF